MQYVFWVNLGNGKTRAINCASYTTVSCADGSVHHYELWTNPPETCIPADIILPNPEHVLLIEQTER